MLSFEHPSACTNLHWVALHARHGFAVREVRLFHEHSIMLACEMLPAPEAPCAVDARGVTRALVRDYSRAVEARTLAILAAADDKKANWLFGAHNNAQVIFMYGGAHMEALFEGLLDNSPLKHGKRLYGTGLVVRKPADAVGAAAPPPAPGAKPLRVFFNIGMYNEKVCARLTAPWSCTRCKGKGGRWGMGGGMVQCACARGKNRSVFHRFFRLRKKSRSSRRHFDTATDVHAIVSAYVVE